MIKILIIAHNSCKELYYRKAVWIVAGTAVVCYGLPFWITSDSFFGERGPRFVTTLTNLYAFVGLCFSAFFAALSYDAETSRRTIGAVLVRPIERWQYFAGRLLGVYVLFTGFLMVGLCVSIALLGAKGAVPPAALFAGTAQYFASGICWLTILFCFGVLASPALSLLAVISVVFASWITAKVPSDLHAVVPWIQAAFHYILPVDPPAHYWTDGDVPSDAAFLSLAAIVENLLYGAVVFAATCYAMRRRDIRLRGG